MLNRPRGIPIVDDWVASRAGSVSPEGGKLAAYRFARIRETLRRVVSFSPFYRERLSGFDIDRIDGPERFADLPFTTADDLRESSHRMPCVSQSDVRRVVTLDTSGTTGNPKRLYFTEKDQRLTVDFFRVGMGSFTEPGDRVMILMPGEKQGSIGDLLAAALKELQAVPIPGGFVRDVGRTLDDLDSGRVDCVVGVPNQVLALARFSEASRGRGTRPPKRVLLSTDYAPRSLAGELSRIWGCETISYYAMTELGYGGGIECGAHEGYHLYEGDFHFEVVDPETGLPAPEGEIVATTLTREGMPLIRYRTGDLSRFLSGPCPCGSPLRRMDRVRARLGSALPVGPRGSLRLSDLDEALFGLPGVLDFSARFEAGPRAALTLELDVLGTSPADSVCRERVEKKFAELGIAEAEFPYLDIKSRDRGFGYVPKLGKRRFVADGMRC